MKTFLKFYARGVAITGSIILGALLSLEGEKWVTHVGSILLLFVAAMALRRFQI